MKPRISLWNEYKSKHWKKPGHFSPGIQFATGFSIMSVCSLDQSSIINHSGNPFHWGMPVRLARGLLWSSSTCKSRCYYSFYLVLAWFCPAVTTTQKSWKRAEKEAILLAECHSTGVNPSRPHTKEHNPLWRPHLACGLWLFWLVSCVLWVCVNAEFPDAIDMVMGRQVLTSSSEKYPFGLFAREHEALECVRMQFTWSPLALKNEVLCEGASANTAHLRKWECGYFFTIVTRPTSLHPIDTNSELTPYFRLSWMVGWFFD